MDTRDSNRQLALLEERYHQIHRHSLRIRAQLTAIGNRDESRQQELFSGQEALAEAERDQQAILVAIEQIEQHLLE